MYRNRKMNPCSALCMVLALLVASAPVQAASKVTCPNKIIDVQTVTGIYLGWFEAEEGLNTIGIQVQGEDNPVYIGASEEEAQKFFGNTAGQQVSVTWQVEQIWLEGMQECLRLEVLKEGHPLAAARQASSVQVTPGKYEYLSTDKNAAGELQLSAPDQSGKMAVAIETVTTRHFHTCEFSGLCTLRDDMLICRSTDSDIPDDPDAYVGIRVLKHGLEVVHHQSMWCGMRGTMEGFYMMQ